jgi:hypothetical protein
MLLDETKSPVEHHRSCAGEESDEHPLIYTAATPAVLLNITRTDRDAKKPGSGHHSRLDHCGRYRH